jgi:hypothetical protein
MMGGRDEGGTRAGRGRDEGGAGFQLIITLVYFARNLRDATLWH